MCKLCLIFLLLCVISYPAFAESSVNGTEAQLVKSLQALNENNLDGALDEINQLVRNNPKFRLAQLVKGDLLMARAGVLEHFGNATNAPSADIADLRDEAEVRLNRVNTQSSPKLIPRFLWQISTEQKYILVVDTSRSTLLVYQNVNGEPHYVTDFYVTIGKLGIKKSAEGDQRTPLGVYFVKAELPKNQLADLYGNGAYPLSYPNEWDSRNKHTGSGIWLHGTPSDTYSRPPRASNGCVVLANTDLDKLAPYLQVGVTPVIITSQLDEMTEVDQSERTALLGEIEQWRKDWSSRNMQAYLNHYADNFSTDSMSYTDWARQKKQVNEGKTWVKVSTSNISLFPYPDQPNMVVVNFEQDYNSNNLSNKMKKRQYWIKQNNIWKIIYEGAA